jgi:hypothetical protein
MVRVLNVLWRGIALTLFLRMSYVLAGEAMPLFTSLSVTINTNCGLIHCYLQYTYFWVSFLGVTA